METLINDPKPNDLNRTVHYTMASNKQRALLNLLTNQMIRRGPLSACSYGYDTSTSSSHANLPCFKKTKGRSRLLSFSHFSPYLSHLPLFKKRRTFPILTRLYFTLRCFVGTVFGDFVRKEIQFGILHLRCGQ